jgi:hypothetical protein
VDEQGGGFTSLTAGVARSIALGRLFEVFLIAAVVSLLLIRGGLALTGFPKVAGGGLHIAHMLWGGLLMLASVLLLLGFIGRRALSAAAFVSGVGFGTFIDEVGKFITSDNDYFFRPAVSVVYVVFVALVLISRALESRRRYSERELMANAFDAAREAHLTGHMPAHSAPLLAYLRAHAGDDPVLVAIRDALERAPREPLALPRPLLRAQRAVVHQYLSLVDSHELGPVIAGVFIGYTAFILLTVGVAVAAYLSSPPPSPLGKGGIAFTGLLASNAVSVLLIVAASTSLRASRLASLTWFHRAVMVDLLLGQVFAFYLLQFGALLGVGLDLVALLILSGAMRTERHLEQHGHSLAG